MKSAGYLAQAETYHDLENAERMLNKLVRSFATLTEALKRHRTVGEQNVTVQNVSVQDGGQAIVGNATQRAPDQTASATLAVTDARTAPMPILDAPRPRIAPAWRKS
jgi:hypothetical protein